MIRKTLLALAAATIPVILLGSTVSGAAPTPRPSALSFGDWPSWQGDVQGDRSNPAELLINPLTVGRLKLKWAYAYPADRKIPAKSQPAVVGDRIYFGSPDGKFHSLNARTGRGNWTFDLHSVGPKRVVTVLDGPAVHGDTVYFGDSRGYLFALDRWTGMLDWMTYLAGHPAAFLTSSPLYYRGRIYVGTSSADNTGGPDSPCCTFRGHIDSVDARTGKLAWRYYTVPKPHRAGNWPGGAPKYEPSGGGVWGSPAIDPATDTLYVGTGQNYTGHAGDFDSVLALNAETGRVQWKRKMNNADTWRSTCNGPNAEKYCPGLHNGTALDYDLGASPNIFRVNGQTRIGIGQKSGVYHVFDARTGKILWQRQLSEPLPSGGISGIQWGSSYDGNHIYVATYFAEPGTLYALDPATGKTVWKTPNPANGCTTGGAAKDKGCALAMQPAVSTSPGLVYEGSTDGKQRAFSARTGKVLWTYDTVRDFRGVNGLIGHGSQLAGGGGAVVSHGMLYAQSGYPQFPSKHGFVLLAFGL